MNFPSPEFDEAVAAVCDGSLSERQAEELNALLRADEAARDEYLWRVELHARLACDADGILGKDANAVSEPAPVAQSSWRRAALALAACLAVLLGGVWLWPRAGSQEDIVELVRATGSVSWSSEDGRVRPALEAGARLGEGSLTVEGAASSAVVKFRDGSELTLAGDAELSFSDQGQKRLTLRRGAFSADVCPQTAGRPMVIRTPAAEAEVLGTKFSISAAAEQSTLSVDTGRVRLRRLADGATVEVASAQSAVATLDATVKMEASSRGVAAARWREDFRAKPSELWRGVWLPADGAERARMATAPHVAGTRKDGTKVITQAVSRKDSSAGRIVSLMPDSVLTMKLRMQRPRPVTVLLSRHESSGAFAGNYELVVPPSAGQTDANGWRTVSVPVSSFVAKMRGHQEPPLRGQVSLVYIVCYEAKAGMEIAEVAIESAQAGTSTNP